MSSFLTLLTRVSDESSIDEAKSRTLASSSPTNPDGRNVAERSEDNIKSISFGWKTNLEMEILGGPHDHLHKPTWEKAGILEIQEVELKDTEEKLHKDRLELNRTKSKKPSLSDWKKKFMNSGNELEHEAFLVYWLSTFVFPFNNTAMKMLSHIAIKLARGSRIALAPAVLAGIYRDLKMMKENICALSKNENDVHDLNPTIIRGFKWRPYCNNAIRNWDLPKFYPDKEVILPDGPVSDEDFVLLGRFSEIAGNHYDENISNFELYIPPRRFEAEVSERYLKWWKQFVLGQKEEPRSLLGLRKDH
ncbi:protein-serine/threonine phosphatase [Senna tora]|uniref:Protein-serine/threonine phosphatase n=1 Tax=Senna tora TaxID=362788 RepID=A0A834VXR0_9FABA|nr:protein-serine/threonine phosphatase [Senna tora]